MERKPRFRVDATAAFRSGGQQIVTPNEALEGGDIDANLFQHRFLNKPRGPRLRFRVSTISWRKTKS